jgi:hypothetical protein
MMWFITNAGEGQAVGAAKRDLRSSVEYRQQLV